jgi:hypothetical protein
MKTQTIDQVQLMEELIEQEILLRQARDRAVLRQQLGMAWRNGMEHHAITTDTTPAKRTMSAAGRKRIAAAQQARWAKKRTDEALTIAPTNNRKASWTLAMRKAQSDRMRKTQRKLQTARKAAAAARKSS